MFAHFNWLYFTQCLIGGIGMGTLCSLSISINIRVQKRFKFDRRFLFHFIQTVTYLVSLGILAPTVIYIVINLIDALNASSCNTVILFIGGLTPLIVAFKSGLIPKER